MAKNPYIEERAFEKQSQIRLRGKTWYQAVYFLFATSLATLLALVVGTIANVVWYLLRCLWNVFAEISNLPLLEPLWLTDYLQALVQQSLTGQTLLSNNWVVSGLMLLVFSFLTAKNMQRWWDWT